MAERLRSLSEGQMVLLGGDRVVRVDAQLAAAFNDGDRLLVAGDELLHVPATEAAISRQAVDAALTAFTGLASCSDEQIDAFFAGFASRLADVEVADALRSANESDVVAARERGRATTRLILDDRMLADMITGLEMWRDLPGARDAVVSTVDHPGWSIDVRRAPLGVVGFVFEGRPNVFADAAGVVRTGNTAVLRIGSDALGTAQAIVTHALAPALKSAGLPPGTVTLVESAAHAAGWALFADDRLSLAVARGSGPAVDQLGSIARSAGVPASLHGTGGAWMIVAPDADRARLTSVIGASLDRKVCNTLNVCCVPREQAEALLPAVIAGAARAGRDRDTTTIIHMDDEVRALVASAADLDAIVAAPMPDGGLGVEWEWDANPEFTLIVVDNIADAVDRCNRHSPHFVVSVVTDNPDTVAEVYRSVDAPFVGDGFTRWVDGQYALSEPELGLSNWEHGRLLGRGGVLTGASVHTLRLVARFADAGITR
ncbi:MAG: aldehyde dehydrogenase family protein [Actinomycetota bacterium]|nr:aldehyde dehydrogenase family protein [Actinomycetota bacterium]MDA3015312.1 aldehyde dehydrogenase family protein [Actinomycetota bacterium]MDA3027839.1 aldehyde dehydrogenase family protein [Actinomycetota bacterium]